MLTLNDKNNLWELLNKARMLLINSKLEESKSSKLQNRISSIIYAIDKLKTEDGK